MKDLIDDLFDNKEEFDEEFDEEGNFTEKQIKVVDTPINTAESYIDTGSIDTYNIERTSDVTGKKVTNYVDNDTFCNAVIHWNKACAEALEAEQKKPLMPDVIGIQIKMMAEGLARRYNFRNYCVDHETEALTKRGWLSVHEINEDDIILSMDPSDGKLKWSKIFEIFRNEKYDDLMFHLQGSTIDALVTPGHKFLTSNGLKKVEVINNEYIITMGQPVDGPDTLSSELPDTLSYELVLSLSIEYRIKMIDYLMDQNGDKYTGQYFHQSKEHIDLFLMLCSMNGIDTSTEFDHGYIITLTNKDRVWVDDIDFNGGRNTNVNIPTVHYKGTIWCPRTEYGTFMCRRGKHVYITGNTYIDEMTDDAIYMATRAVKNFNPEKSNNAFGYFNRVMWQAMTSRITTEKAEHEAKMSLLKDPMYIGYTSETGGNDQHIDKDRMISVYDN